MDENRKGLSCWQNEMAMKGFAATEKNSDDITRSDMERSGFAESGEGMEGRSLLGNCWIMIRLK